MVMKNLDLNLLRVLDMLVEQRSVTRTADRLGLTQSAVSHALARLRETLDDPLFTRGPRGLHPTARTLELASGIREGLLRLDNALKPSQFDPAKAVRRFNMVAGGYFLTHFMPEVVARARAVAPHISFRVYPLGEDPASLLEQGIADIAVSSPAFFGVTDRMPSELLYEEELIWIAAHASPLGHQPMSLDDISALPRVNIGMRQLNDTLVRMDIYGDTRASVAAQHSSRLPSSTDAMIVYDARGAIETVARTDLVALVPRRATTVDIERKRIKVIELTAPPPKIRLAAIWHARQSHDPGLIWLRSLFHRAAA